MLIDDWIMFFCGAIPAGVFLYISIREFEGREAAVKDALLWKRRALLLGYDRQKDEIDQTIASHDAAVRGEA